DEEYEEIIPGFEDDTQDDTQEFNEQDFTVNGVTFKMIAVKGGTFHMGDDNGLFSNEKPAHDETVSDFYIGQTEVTQDLWMAVMGTNPSINFRPYYVANLPVEYVSWGYCNTFIAKLNELTGKTFRLPTEAEWEYAARGGNKSQGYEYSGASGWGGLCNVAWFDRNSSTEIHPVAHKQPNELGLYDMTGNVWEWTSDKYSTDYNSARTSSNRVVRGGSWASDYKFMDVVYRSNRSESAQCNDLGLRLAL
ncbi:MAG: formylglycine-generating enzyme family protein, partial [Paramuribaculum sp.]|nr:formylglycine-generating enzyme family protein [Paramuribaculum sp.]